ncbi:hypothetical protein [Sphingomonas sp.]|uniref:hypothetical protein n=1 Tax=Sphingomonas sp. TaxID=28214 RepID=UPI0025D3089C|nr:hypothetical protein [Sphingomonas sp.]
MIFTIALMLQAAAPPAEVELSEADARQMIMIAGSRRTEAVEQMRKLKGDQLAAALTDAIGHKTRMIYKDGVGVIVEYMAPGGEFRLWLPGRDGIVVGQWGVQRQKKKKQVNACFRYGAAASASPIVYGPNECVTPEQTLSAANVIREWRGDVFSLMSGHIPYVKSAMGMPVP